jgi:hypothetical protein
MKILEYIKLCYHKDFLKNIYLSYLGSLQIGLLSPTQQRQNEVLVPFFIVTKTRTQKTVPATTDCTPAIGGLCR